MNRYSQIGRRSRMAGLSLVEVMISLVIGLVVIGAVLVSYIGSGQTNKRQVAYSEMNENAQIAFSILRRELLMAGYAQPVRAQVNVAGATVFQRTFAGNAIFGCDVGFETYNAVALACKAGVPDKPAIEISYEADATNTVPSGAPPIPSDCLGTGLNPLVAGGVTYYIANNRFYLQTGATGRSELHCASGRTPAVPGQPIVDNVEDMQIWYGEANAADPRRAVRYVTASDVVSWALIVTVRVCLLMKSSDAVLDGEDALVGADKYLDCNSASQTSADRAVRRAYVMTTGLRNKTAL